LVLVKNYWLIMVILIGKIKKVKLFNLNLVA
jgi:hypothetical protein